MPTLSQHTEPTPDASSGLTLEPFVTWLVRASAESLVVDPSDIRREAVKNWWSWPLRDEIVAARPLEQARAFVLEAARRRQAASFSLGFPPGSLLFYCWRDPGEGELCWSTVSSSHEGLPFSCAVARVAELDTVLEEWFAWELLHPDDPRLIGMEEEPDGELVLKVWVTPL